MTPPGDLVRDPLFQLNTVLWITMPLPDGHEIRPVLHERGFEIDAIGKKIVLTPEMRSRIGKLGLPCQDSVSPDALLRRGNDRRYVIIECKARSFGEESSTARQARALLIVCDLSQHDSLGLGEADINSNAVSFWVDEGDLPAMGKTCASIQIKLRAANLPAGNYHNIGLGIEEANIVLATDDATMGYFGLDAHRTPIMPIQTDSDPRPLYLIPIDPDCDQTSDERAFCERILFERIHGSILAATARATPEQDISISVDALLGEATSGLYARWENRNAIKFLKDKVRKLLGAMSKKTGHSGARLARAEPQKNPDTWTVRFDNSVTQEKFREALAQFSCEDFKTKQTAQDTQLPLFNDDN